MDAYRAHLRRIGLTTGPTDRDRAEEALRRLYRDAGRDEPCLIVWVGSPAALLAEIVERGPCIGTGLWRSLGGAVGDATWRTIWAHLEAESGPETWEDLRGSVWRMHCDPCWDGDAFRSVRDRRGSWAERGRSEVGWRACVVDRANDVVGLWTCRSFAQDEWLSGDFWATHWDPHTIVWGVSFDSSTWVGDLLPRRALASLPEQETTEPTPPLLALAECAGPWYAGEYVALLSERPTALQLDDEDRLHCDAGPALAWPGGQELYALHGVRVSRATVLAPHDLTSREILTEANVETRRVMLERLGYERFFAGAEMTEDGRDETGTLWSADLSDDEPLVLLEVENATPERDGTRKRYLLRVPPFDWASPRDAVAWTFGLDADAYDVLAES